MRKRLLIPPLTLLTLILALELTARALHLERRDQMAIAVDANLARTMPDGTDLGLDYLPRDFVLDETGFTSHWGRCDFTAPGPRVLALGDSTTRQVGVVDGEPDPAALSWPMRLKARLRDDVQVCVLAEDGYHPVDQAILAEHIAKLWPPDLTVALWCDNDLYDEAARIRERDGDTVRVILRNPSTQVWRPLYIPWLLDRSVALGFIASRLGELTGDVAERPVVLPRTRSVVDAVRRIDALPGELRAFHIPRLVEDDREGVHRTNELADQARVPIFNLPIPQPREGLRVEPSDLIHPNAEGHRLVAAGMLQGVISVVPLRPTR